MKGLVCNIDGMSVIEMHVLRPVADAKAHIHDIGIAYTVSLTEDEGGGSLTAGKVTFSDPCSYPWPADILEDLEVLMDRMVEHIAENSAIFDGGMSDYQKTELELAHVFDLVDYAKEEE